MFAFPFFRACTTPLELTAATLPLELRQRTALLVAFFGRADRLQRLLLAALHRLAARDGEALDQHGLHGHPDGILHAVLRLDRDGGRTRFPGRDHAAAGDGCDALIAAGPGIGGLSAGRRDFGRQGERIPKIERLRVRRADGHALGHKGLHGHLDRVRFAVLRLDRDGGRSLFFGG